MQRVLYNVLFLFQKTKFKKRQLKKCSQENGDEAGERKAIKKYFKIIILLYSRWSTAAS